MSPLRSAPSLAILLTTVACLALMVAPVAPFESVHSSSVATGARSAAHVAPAAARTAGNVQVGGRTFSSVTTAALGDEYNSRVAVDNATKTVYAISRAAPVLNAFDAASGTPLRQVIFGNDSTYYQLADVAFDNKTGEVYVAVQNYGLGGGFVSVLTGSTFAFVTNISFGTSTVTTFEPYRLLYVWQTNTVFAENYTTNDVMVLNATSNTIGNFVVVPCSGYLEFGGCTSDFAMFVDISVLAGPLVVVPSGSGYVWVVTVNSNLTFDLLGSGFAAPYNTSFGAGTFSPYSYSVYFENRSNSGRLMEYNGTTSAMVFEMNNTPSYVQSMMADPVTGWIVMSEYNNTAGDTLVGFYIYLLTPAWTTSNVALSANSYIDSLAFLSQPNGTGYLVTGGWGVWSGLYLQMFGGVTAPATRSTYTYNAGGAFPIVADASTGSMIQMESDLGYVVASSEATGATLWSWSVPTAGAGLYWADVDAALGVVYVGAYVPGGGAIYMLSATTGSLLGTLGLTYAPDYIAFGANHRLYATDYGNNTIQGYSDAGGAGTLSWAITLTMPVSSSMCSLGASPVAAFVAVENCGYNDELVINATSGAVAATVPGSTAGYSAVFDASGNLYSGNDTTYGVAVYAAGNWTHIRTVTSPVPVYWVAAEPQVHALAVSYSTGEVALINATTGATLAAFHANGPLDNFAVDPVSGTIGISSTDGALTLERLVALPLAASGLSAKGGNDTLNVSWTAVTGSAGFPITGYTVYTSASASGPWSSVGTPTATNDLLTGLTDGTTYYVTVRALSAAGNGPTATPVSGVPIGVPFPPTSLAVTATTGSSVTLTWGAPSSTQGSAVTGYTVLYASSASGPWTSSSAGTALTATITGLTAGTKYYFEVEAANGAGTGHATTSVTASTPSSSSSGGLGSALSGGSLLLIVGIIVVVVIVAIVVAMMMMRKRGGSGPSSTPPASAPVGTSTPPPSGSPPPGAMGDSGAPPAPPSS